MMSEIQDYAIIFLDEDGKILEWNKGAEKLKGYKATEILGKSFRLFYTEEDRKANLPQRLLDDARDHGFVSHEGYRIRKDGTRFWGHVVITAIHDDNNKVIGFSKVTKDLTERKNADDRVSIFTQELHQKNEALRQSEERYHRMIAEVQDYAILLMDKEGNIQNWNAGAEFIKGYSAEEIIGKNFRLFYTSEDIRSRLPERLLLEAEIKGKASNEGWRKRKDGTLFWANVIITALHDDTGNVIGFSKVTRDLTDKKKTDDELKQKTIDLELKNLELEKLNAELSSFAYVVSHDLKEPIRKIQVFAGRQLEQDKTPEQVFDYSNKIIATASRMQNLMLALLNYSQLTKGDLPTEKVNLNLIANAVIHDLEIIISDNKAEITKDSLPIIPGIDYQLHQLFLNLMSNALKFSKPSIPPKISITCRPVQQAELPDILLLKNRDYCLITFTDEGLGFEQEHAARIFEVFQRLRPKDDISGTGIGLSIVKKVVTNHDGLIEVESQLNKGTSFKIYLPQ